MICRSEVIFFYCNKNKKKEVVKENVNSRLLVSTLNKTNKNELIVVRTNYSIVEPIVFRKVNTLMEVRNMNEINKKPKRRETSLQSDVCSLMMAVVVIIMCRKVCI